MFDRKAHEKADRFARQLRAFNIYAQVFMTGPTRDIPLLSSVMTGKKNIAR